MGIVRWIGARKGDPVKKDQVVVLLDDSEQRARVTEAEGRRPVRKRPFKLQDTLQSPQNAT